MEDIRIVKFKTSNLKFLNNSLILESADSRLGRKLGHKIF